MYGEPRGRQPYSSNPQDPNQQPRSYQTHSRPRRQRRDQPAGLPMPERRDDGFEENAALANQAGIADFETKSREELLEIAKGLGISGFSSMGKQDLVYRLLQAQTEQQGNIFSGGVLDIVDDGYGFLRGETMLPHMT